MQSLLRVKSWGKKNPDKIKESIKKYRKNNVEKYRELSRANYLRHRNDYIERRRKYVSEHREELNAKAREAYHKNINGRKDKIRSRNKSLESRYAQYKYRAKSKNLAFALSYNRFVELMSSTCFYCGKERSKRTIDRLNYRIGYVEGNVVPSCLKCNVAKNKQSPSEFIQMCREVVEYYDGKRSGSKPKLFCCPDHGLAAGD